MTKFHLLLKSNVDSKEPNNAKTLYRKKKKKEKKKWKGGILLLGQRYLSNTSIYTLF